MTAFLPEMLIDSAWLAVAVPFALAIVVAVAGSRAVPLTRWLATLGPIMVAWVGATGAAAQWLSRAELAEVPAGRMLASGSATWIAAGASRLEVGWFLDGLGSVMLVVVGLVAAMVMVFSGGYMAGERGLARYYAVLSLFTAAMAALVLADGFLTAFIGWEVMGACSYLLIGFWFEKPSASSAATKAFLVTRVGDAGLLLGMATLWVWGEWGSSAPLGFAQLAEVAEGMAPGLALVAALLVLAGAVGKSAQFPLHVWLPDAMEGPTPVSALIHAATMVAAGVFLVVRAWPLFEVAPLARDVTLALGTITALGAAAAAVAQTDLKKVLAYSTLSQLGFMFAALGAGAPAAASYHLVTHAAFKSLLFLGAGSVIHGAHTQDIREMGGLARRMPLTATTWLVGALALAGLPPLSGFFSKDAAIHAVYSAQPVAGVALFAASLLTAFYVARATRLTFFGEPRFEGHAHETLSMTGPLVVLAIPAAVLGLVGANLLFAIGVHDEAPDVFVAGVATTLALVGLLSGWLLYRRGPAGDSALSKVLGPAWPALRAAYGLEPIVRRVFGYGVVATSRTLYRTVDRAVVDRLVDGVGGSARGIGSWFARLQNGDGQWYSSLVGAGVIVALAIALSAGR